MQIFTMQEVLPRRASLHLERRVIGDMAAKPCGTCPPQYHPCQDHSALGYLRCTRDCVESASESACLQDTPAQNTVFSMLLQRHSRRPSTEGLALGCDLCPKMSQLQGVDSEGARQPPLSSRYALSQG